MRYGMSVAFVLVCALGMIHAGEGSKHLSGELLRNAASKTDIKEMERLIREGYPVNERDDKGETALHKAVWWLNVDAVKLLLDNKADVNAKDIAGQTPLHEAGGSVRDASGVRRVVIAEMLLKKGAKIDARDYSGSTPLHIAAAAIREDMVQALIANGADVNAINYAKNTPLDLVPPLTQYAIEGLPVAFAVEENKWKRSTTEALVKAGGKGAHAIKNAKVLYDDTSDAAFCWALKYGSRETVESLLNKGANINLQGEGGMTTLHLAVQRSTLLRDDVDDREILGMLLFQRKDLQNETQDIVKFILAKIKNINTKDNAGNTPLHLAARSGDIEVVKALLNKGADANARNIDEWTPLHEAAKSLDPGTAELLLDKGADIHAKTKSGKTPLDLVGRAGFLEGPGTSVRRANITPLLRKRAVLSAASKGGANLDQAGLNDLLMEAATNGNAKEAEHFIRLGANVNSKWTGGYTILHRAAGHGRATVVAVLLDNGADINARFGRAKETPLHSAAESGHTDSVRALLEKGGDVNAKNGDGLTPLHLAAKKNRVDTVTMLLSKGADASAKTDRNVTPLHLAAGNGNMNIVQALLDGGSSVNALNDGGYGEEGNMTPLHMAAANGNPDVVKLLLTRGADVNAKGNRKTTPLHNAAYRGNAEAAKMLLDAKADVNAAVNMWNEEGMTSLHMAAKGSHIDVVKVLLASGANVNAVGNRGTTPLSITNNDKIKTLLKAGNGSSK